MMSVKTDKLPMPPRRIFRRGAMPLACITAVLLLYPAMGAAQAREADLIKQMETNGYVLVDRSKSWLGRVVLDFENQTAEREIIFSPVNGEILRDYSEPLHRNEEENEVWYYHMFRTLFGEKGD